MTTPPPEAADIKRRRFLRLICDVCGLNVGIQTYEDPLQGDGWPLHKCRDFKPRAFDRWEPDLRAAQSKGAPFKD